MPRLASIYLTYKGIFVKRFVVYATIIFSIHGNRIIRQPDMTSIFGTKTNVISCICVAA